MASPLSPSSFLTTAKMELGSRISAHLYGRSYPPSPKGFPSKLPLQQSASMPRGRYPVAPRASSPSPLKISCPLQPEIFLRMPSGVERMIEKEEDMKLLQAWLSKLPPTGVDGVHIDVAWGLVEGRAPFEYQWDPYVHLVKMAEEYGLKVRVAMGFHRRWTADDDVPLPAWIDIQSLCHKDSQGNLSDECISIAQNHKLVLPFGRTPIEAYGDLLLSFKQNFHQFLGSTIQGIQLGTGPAGEARYPFISPKALSSASFENENGLFQCFDEAMLSRFIDKSDFMKEFLVDQKSDSTDLLKRVRQTPLEQLQLVEDFHVFCRWYQWELIQHIGSMILRAEDVFGGEGVELSIKLALPYWSRLAELTAGYQEIAHFFTVLSPVRGLCVHGIDLEPDSIMLARMVEIAAQFRVPLHLENVKMVETFSSFLRVLRFRDAFIRSECYSFTYNRMTPELFEGRLWDSFSSFVREWKMMI